MPLESGSSGATISKNIGELIDAGHEPDQAAAIAYKKAGKANDALARIGRDAFIFMSCPENIAPQDHAQCVSCKKLVPSTATQLGHDACAELGSEVTVGPRYSCGLYSPWPSGQPDPDIIAEHAAKLGPEGVPPEEAGLVEREVRCENCVYPNGDACGLFELLNQLAPEAFALEPAIRGQDCCNAQTPPEASAEDENPDDLVVHDAAGIIFREPGGKVLFLKRGPLANNPGEWDWPGGHLQPGETLEQGAIREAHEETGYLADASRLKPVSREITDDVDFSTFICPVDEMFTPNIGRDEDGHREHDDWVWRDPRDPPEPMHHGVEDVLSNPLLDEIAEAAPTVDPDDPPEDVEAMVSEPVAAEDEAKLWVRIERAVRGELLALDKASVRSYDADGRLHIALTPISKANICPYQGKEIPEWQKLGLKADQVYMLLRDPEALAAAAATSNLVPLLEIHLPTSAEDHPQEITVGSLGTDGVWEDPYVFNSLVIWPQYAIDDVEEEFKRELSSSYRYKAIMEPGTFRGEPYDGRMVDIVFNHVALVEEGRAGADVAVADSLADDVKWALVEDALRMSSG